MKQPPVDISGTTIQVPCHIVQVTAIVGLEDWGTPFTNMAFNPNRDE